MPSLPLFLRAYRAATAALEPAVPLLLRRRARRGKEDATRISERLGYAAKPRPDGNLVWIHGASVGESLSVLPLIGALLEAPGRSVLMTSGTVTSATMMAERLPPRAIHQFSPVDAPGAVARFLDHWRPDAALFVDSEIWPNTLLAAKARGIGLAIVNGRMSERSFANWRNAKAMAASLLSLYDACLVQDDDSAERLEALGAHGVTVTGNLKADAPVLPADPARLETLVRAVGSRPVLLAASTHAGEETLLLEADQALRAQYPSLLTIVVPRHPERGAEVEALCGSRSRARRAAGHNLQSGHDVYIADTIGELGLFYRVAPFAFVGGSLVPHGGQNPLEAARLGLAVLAGPYTDNFRTAYEAIFAAQGCGRVAAVADIVALAQRFLAAPAEAKRLGQAADAAARRLGGALERTLGALEQLLSGHARA